MRSRKGTTQANLQGHLAETWYRSINPKDPSMLFINLLKELKTFCQV